MKKLALILSFIATTSFAQIELSESEQLSKSIDRGFAQGIQTLIDQGEKVEITIKSNSYFKLEDEEVIIARPHSIEYVDGISGPCIHAIYSAKLTEETKQKHQLIEDEKKSLEIPEEHHPKLKKKHAYRVINVKAVQSDDENSKKVIFEFEPREGNDISNLSINMDYLFRISKLPRKGRKDSLPKEINLDFFKTYTNRLIDISINGKK